MLRQLQTEQTRRKIIETTERLFTTDSYEKVTMRRIAEESGLGLGTFYQYFSNKHDLLRELTEDMNTAIADAIDAAGGMKLPSAAARYETYVNVYSEMQRRFSSIERAFSIGLLTESDAIMNDMNTQRLVDQLQGIYDMGVASGEFHPLCTFDAFHRQFFMTVFGSSFYRNIVGLNNAELIHDMMEGALMRLLPILKGNA